MRFRSQVAVLMHSLKHYHQKPGNDWVLISPRIEPCEDRIQQIGKRDRGRDSISMTYDITNDWHPCIVVKI
jgi:hypothetical protein